MIKTNNNIKFLKTLKKLRSEMIINTQQMRTLKGQYLSGDKDGAIKGLKKLIRRYEKNNEIKMPTQ